VHFPPRQTPPLFFTAIPLQLPLVFSNFPPSSYLPRLFPIPPLLHPSSVTFYCSLSSTQPFFLLLSPTLLFAVLFFFPPPSYSLQVFFKSSPRLAAPNLQDSFRIASPPPFLIPFYASPPSRGRIKTPSTAIPPTLSSMIGLRFFSFLNLFFFLRSLDFFPPPEFAPPFFHSLL